MLRKQREVKSPSGRKVALVDENLIDSTSKRPKRYELRNTSSRIRNNNPKEDSSNDSKSNRSDKLMGTMKQSLTPKTTKLGIKYTNDIAKRVEAVICGYLRKDSNILTKDRCAEINTLTRGNWCLLQGLIHIASAHNGILLPIIEKNGPPSFYFSHMTTPCRHDEGKTPVLRNENKDHFESFRILCRIIAGQQLAGAAAKSVWSRLLEAVGGNVNNTSPLVPKKILKIASNGDDEIENVLRKPAGLSKSKARSIIDLARHFESGNLSDYFLFGKGSCDVKSNEGSKGSDIHVRDALLQVKGIGPWSCDMFQLFHTQRPDILPLGDLGVRKGTTLLFNMKGKGKNGILCEKKDADLLEKLHEPFAPYRSLSTFYMWRCADTIAFNEDK